MDDLNRSTTARPICGLLLMLVGPLLLGGLIAPHVFNALPSITDRFSDADFERVANRCVMVMALLLLYPALRLAGMGGRIADGLKLDKDRVRDLLLGLLLAFASMAVLYLGGWVTGAYRPDKDLREALWSGRLIPLLVGATFIGVFEEAFFRGFVFGALRQRLSLAAAALWASAFFSIIHFMRPVAPTPIEHAAWYDGFALFPHMLARFEPANDWAFMLTLFLMGLALCGFYERRKNLYLVIGLHGGWVFAMQSATEALDRTRDVLPWLFGHSALISKAPVATLLILIFAVFAYCPRRAAQPPPPAG